KQKTAMRYVTLNRDGQYVLPRLISHLTYLIASSLVHKGKKWEEIHNYLPVLAAGSFRDITRIASSNPKMWQDIFLHNKTKLSRLLQDWINEMVTLKEFLDMNKEAEMVHYLNEAKDYRDGLNAYS